MTGPMAELEMLKHQISASQQADLDSQVDIQLESASVLQSTTTTAKQECLFSTDGSATLRPCGAATSVSAVSIGLAAAVCLTRNPVLASKTNKARTLAFASELSCSHSARTLLLCKRLPLRMSSAAHARPAVRQILYVQMSDRLLHVIEQR